MQPLRPHYFSWISSSTAHIEPNTSYILISVTATKMMPRELQLRSHRFKSKCSLPLIIHFLSIQMIDWNWFFSLKTNIEWWKKIELGDKKFDWKLLGEVFSFNWKNKRFQQRWLIWMYHGLLEYLDNRNLQSWTLFTGQEWGCNR